MCHQRGWCTIDHPCCAVIVVINICCTFVLWCCIGIASVFFVLYFLHAHGVCTAGGDVCQRVFVCARVCRTRGVAVLGNVFMGKVLLPNHHSNVLCACVQLAMM